MRNKMYSVEDLRLKKKSRVLVEFLRFYYTREKSRKPVGLLAVLVNYNSLLRLKINVKPLSHE